MFVNICAKCCSSFQKRMQVLQSLYRIMSTSMSTGNDHLQRTVTKPRNEIISKAEVLEMKNLSNTVLLLRLQVDNKNFSFKAGQWVDMFIPGVETVGGFSMSSPPHLLSETGQLHLAVKYATHPPALWVHTKCQVGSEVRLRVGGDFHYPLDSDTGQKDLLLLAGGVGVNPLYSMLQHFVYCLQLKEDAFPKDSLAHMLYSAKSEEELIFKDELLSITKSVSNVKLSLFSSQEKPSSPSPVLYGRIEASDVLGAMSRLDVTHTDVFLCGPLPFIEDMKSHCKSAGVPDVRVHYESWW